MCRALLLEFLFCENVKGISILARAEADLGGGGGGGVHPLSYVSYEQ